jgi:phosphopantothenoylcysteine synthetase/decarboxylase
MSNDGVGSSPQHPLEQQSLKGREVIVAVCGGIAAYKVADVVSKLVQRGTGVTVCMTREATRFVTPLTFQALSGRPVRTDTFNLLDSSDPPTRSTSD